MSLDPETRKATVLYRIEKAKSTWDDALFCIDKEMWNMAANRMYYALFHTVSALLIANSIPANTHRGFHIQMNKYLVQDGTMTKEEARLVRHLFDLRHEDDYEDFIDATKEDVMEYLPEAKALIDKLISLNKLAPANNSN